MRHSPIKLSKKDTNNSFEFQCAARVAFSLQGREVLQTLAEKIANDDDVVYHLHWPFEMNGVVLLERRQGLYQTSRRPNPSGFWCAIY
jgi:hypothetical protein